MTEIVLKPELLKNLQKVLVEYEPKNEDPILASQYLSAVVGSIVATAEIPKKDKDSLSCTKLILSPITSSNSLLFQLSKKNPLSSMIKSGLINKGPEIKLPLLLMILSIFIY